MRSVEEYIDQLPDDRRILIEKLRVLILSLVPGIEERFTYKIPFYHFFGMFMYLNNTHEGIDVGFCRGNDLTPEFPQLATKDRAIVATLLIQSQKDITVLNLREIIVAAAAWNEEAKKNKIPMIPKSSKRKSLNQPVSPQKKK